jgi:hypothetical protein
MWRRAGLVKADVSQERVASIFTAEEITRARKSVRRQIRDWTLNENLRGRAGLSERNPT